MPKSGTDWRDLAVLLLAAFWSRRRVSGRSVTASTPPERSPRLSRHGQNLVSQPIRAEEDVELVLIRRRHRRIAETGPEIERNSQRACPLHTTSPRKSLLPCRTSRSPAALRCTAKSAVAASKNAALPIMAAAILASEPVRLENVPRLADVRTQAGCCGTWDCTSFGTGRRRVERHLAAVPSPANPPCCSKRSIPGRFRRRKGWCGGCGRASACSGRCWPARQGRRAAARRLQHRPPAGRFAPEGPGRPGGRHAAGTRLRRGRRPAIDRRQHRPVRPERPDRHRHGQRAERRRARPRRHRRSAARPSSRKSSIWAGFSSPWGRESKGWARPRSASRASSNSAARRTG